MWFQSVFAMVCPDAVTRACSAVPAGKCGTPYASFAHHGSRNIKNDDPVDHLTFPFSFICVGFAQDTCLTNDRCATDCDI